MPTIPVAVLTCARGQLCVMHPARCSISMLSVHTVQVLFLFLQRASSVTVQSRSVLWRPAVTLLVRTLPSRLPQPTG